MRSPPSPAILRKSGALRDTYGTLEPGKDADVVIWDGDPLNVTSAPTAVFIRGQNIPLVSRQTKLRDRYRDLQTRVSALRLPLAPARKSV